MTKGIKEINFFKESEEKLIFLWFLDKISSDTKDDDYTFQGTKKELKIIKKEINK